MQKIVPITNIELINDLLSKKWKIDYKIDENHVILYKQNKPRNSNRGAITEATMVSRRY